MLKSTFPQDVYRLTSQIPKGMVTSYGHIASALNNSKAVRAVGNALNKNPYSPQVPCHRVVKANGEIGGYAKGANQKRDMLKREGITIKNGRIDLKKHLYEFDIKEENKKHSSKAGGIFLAK